MSSSKQASLRLIFDFQACQTEGSAKRGVGRSAQALFEHLFREHQRIDLWTVVSSTLPYEPTLGGLPENRIVRLPSLPSWPSDRVFLGGERDYLDALAYSSLIAPLNSDIIHVPHVFEGYNDTAVLPSPALRPPGQILSATLHDLIPLIFRSHYFQDDAFRKWYLSRLSWLKQADLILAVSESSRQDAINLLGLEAWRIVTIHGGVSPYFEPVADRISARHDLARRYGLRQRFVLYAGGDDYRKNLDGAISAYALIPRPIRRECQLIIACSMEHHRREIYLESARKAGLTERDIAITGFVSEQDLRTLYQTCDAFFFPSLYEGFGLPILEAMACGAPVIGGNNSSIQELIRRKDALFDAGSVRSTAEILSRVLTDDTFASDLRRYGLERAKEFSWSRTAARAVEAFEDALGRLREGGVRSALLGWTPRKRLAILSPLPPCRSGIADYNAVFLPYLARHFDIDVYVDNYTVIDDTLTSTFRIFNVAAFERVAQDYDAILYEFGNSEFHHHMLPLLERFPGVVGLHDAYLSGMFGYLDFFLGDSGTYAREMIAAHGPTARKYFAPVQNHPDRNSASMVALPCTKRVLDAAVGVISHSPFNLEVAEEHYPERWRAPYRIIPQMVRIPTHWSESQRERVRKVLGFSASDFLAATFGHIAWTKCGDRLLEAFLASSLSQRPNVHLIYVGELANDDFGRRLMASIERSDLRDRVHITGYLSKEAYENYLHIVDVALQLRTMSRGGTPKGVLDCLAFRLPVIVNNDASYKDYPDDVVLKLPPEPSTADIAATLESIYLNVRTRTAFAQAGLDYVRAKHDPSYCAANYAAAIHEFSERATQFKPTHTVKRLAPHLARCKDVEAASQATADWLEAIPQPSFRRRRLFVDVSHIARSDHKTGIPRVVKEIVRSLYCSRRAGVEPVAVELNRGALRIASPWLRTQGLLLTDELSPEEEPPPVVFRPGDVLLMLDSSWARYREFFPTFAEARRYRVPIFTVIYDLLPIVLPPEDVVEGGKEWFEGWVRDAVEASDGVLCISRAAATEVSAYIAALPNLPRRPLVTFWHLGSDFSSSSVNEQPTPDVARMKSRPYLLIVGTIEPRKAHAIALEAMTRLWHAGHDLCLCIAGREGWLVGNLMAKIRTHPLLGKKLFFFDGPSDSDIAFLYANATGLLLLSKGEGFGLPLVEAANHGIPILCSDLPVFHEVAGDFATYVNNSNPEITARDIAAWWAARKADKLPDTRNMPRMTWEESSLSLLSAVFDTSSLGPPDGESRHPSSTQID